MKKSLALLILVSVLIFTWGAFAQEDNSPFALRNGYTWGMSREAAMALAAEEGLIVDYEADDWIRYKNVSAGEYPIRHFVLRFVEEELMTMRYSFPTVEESEFAQSHGALKQALTEKYGEPTPSLIRDYGFEWTLEDTDITLSKILGIEEGCVSSISYYYRPPARVFEEF